jgi:hypothetical protein
MVRRECSAGVQVQWTEEKKRMPTTLSALPRMTQMTSSSSSFLLDHHLYPRTQDNSAQIKAALIGMRDPKFTMES